MKKQTQINIKTQIDALAHAKKLDRLEVLNVIKDALNSTYLKFNLVKRDLIIEGNEKDGILTSFAELDVVNKKTEDFPDSEILFEDAKKINKDIEIGETIIVSFNLSLFSRFSIVQVKQRIKHNLNLLKSEKNYNLFIDKKGTIMSGTIENVDFRRISVDISGIRAFLPREEIIPYQILRPGQIVKFYVKEVFKNNQYGQILGSRTDIEFLKLLFKLEVPEINVGLIKIIDAVHIPGVRAKIAIKSFDSSIDPIGSVIGKGGSRISSISEELKNEKIDVFLWDEDIEKFLLNACTPIKVVNYQILDKEFKEARIIVIKEQYESIIRRGKSWHNLLEEITGFSIEVQTLEEYGIKMKNILLNGNLSYEDLENLEIEKNILIKCKEID